MNPEKTIRKQAKTILSRNNWPASVGVVVTLGVAIMTVVYFSDVLVIGIDYLFKIMSINAFDTLSVLPLIILITFTLVGIIFTLPLLMGSIRYFYLMSKTSKADYSEVFYYCTRKRYLPCLKVYLGLLLRTLWQLAISFIPAIVAYLYATSLSAANKGSTGGSMLLYLASYILMVCGVFLFNALTTKYFSAVYYYIENDNLSAQEICRLSEQYMDKFTPTTVKLNFSLLPMVIACILIIPAIFTLPFVMTVKATSAKWIIELSKRTENKDE